MPEFLAETDTPRGAPGTAGRHLGHRRARPLQAWAGYLAFAFGVGAALAATGSAVLVGRRLGGRSWARP